MNPDGRNNPCGTKEQDRDASDRGKIIPVEQKIQIEMHQTGAKIMGDLYDSYLPDASERWKELPVFFREFRSFVQGLTPTKPVAFARDPEHLNVTEMKQICEECGTHMWVDMEIFREPFEDGLVPKTMEALLHEIHQ